VEYLATLSADATPELMRLPPVIRERALADIAQRLAKKEPPTSANLSRARARRHLRRAVAASATPDLP
jgi:hypothetical protein